MSFLDSQDANLLVMHKLVDMELFGPHWSFAVHIEQSHNEGCPGLFLEWTGGDRMALCAVLDCEGLWVWI